VWTYLMGKGIKCCYILVYYLHKYSIDLIQFKSLSTTVATTYLYNNMPNRYNLVYYTFIGVYCTYNRLILLIIKYLL